MTESADKDLGAKGRTHEEVCRERIKEWDDALEMQVKKPDFHQLRALKAAIDTHLAIEELRIKVRVGDWPKTMVWGQLVSPALAAILGGTIGAIIGAWLHR